MRKRFGRPSPALAISLIALFVAMGGTSYGLARNSIDSREIRNNDVRSSDLRNNDVRSKDVRNGSLLSKDFKSGQLPAGAQGATGAPGPRGLQGFQGVQGLKGDTGLKGNTGAPGAPGISGLERVSNASADDSTSGKTASVGCPGNKKVVGTGAISDRRRKRQSPQPDPERRGQRYPPRIRPNRRGSHRQRGQRDRHRLAGHGVRDLRQRGPVGTWTRRSACNAPPPPRPGPEWDRSPGRGCGGGRRVRGLASAGRRTRTGAQRRPRQRSAEAPLIAPGTHP